MYCECGCGQITSISDRTDKKRNVKKGEHVKYCIGHGMKGKKHKQRSKKHCENISKALKGKYYMTVAEKKKRSTKYSGKGNPNWKRGYEIMRGYVYVLAPNHKYVHRGKIKRCRLVAEKALGRELTPNEVVHHIDGNKRNDKSNNLLICTNSYHLQIHYKEKTGIFKRLRDEGK